jgi:hypothetical protein
MPRSPSRLLLPAVALVALIFLSPSLSTAFPEDMALRSAEHSDATPGLFAKLWGLLSAVWTTGSGLEPDGANAGGTDPNAAGSDDTGSGLDPDG